MITMSILQYILCDILLVCGGIQLGMLIVKIINAQEKKQKKKGEKMAIYIDADARDRTSTSKVIPPTHKPTDDVVEVVRCKNCKHSKTANYISAKCPYYCKLMANCHSGDFFCSMGERREDGDNN